MRVGDTFFRVDKRVCSSGTGWTQEFARPGRRVYHTLLLLIVPCGLTRWAKPLCDGPIGQPLSRWSGARRRAWQRGGRRQLREAWEGLRAQGCRAIRIGMRRLVDVVAHSDEQGSARFFIWGTLFAKCLLVPGQGGAPGVFLGQGTL